MKNSKKFFRVLCAMLACVIIVSIMGITVFAKSATYTYSSGTAKHDISMQSVSARLTYQGTANLIIWGQYKYYYKTPVDGNTITPDWQYVANRNVNGGDTGSGGWGTSIPYDGACMYSLHNRFIVNSQLVLDKTINYG